MLSGIGPAEQLHELGIAVIRDRPGVGANLQDHLEILVQQNCTQPITLAKHWNIAGKIGVGLRWMLFKNGAGASNHFETAAFIRSRAGIEYPDIQYHFMPIAARYDGVSAETGHGFQAHVGPMRSGARGQVTLRSPDPWEPPRIVFNYLSDPQDLIDFRHCIRLTREIFGQPAFDAFRGPEIKPGESQQSDSELDGYVRNTAESSYHPCGTSRMGSHADAHAVVDPECRVIGVDALRVVDSSIFPRITNGNLNGPTIMVAEKASDIILGKPALPVEDADIWINSRWQESDR